VAIATAAYRVNADALFELRGLVPGSKIDVAWTRVKDDGTFIDDPWRLTYTADENGVVRDQIGGQFGVDASNRLRLRVAQHGRLGRHRPGLPRESLAMEVLNTDI
jgi:hypothetical protein